jgi:isopentenyl diphosphate isomerase/L-lactate dehydrogenase-like FMN-dependent dehydrogenase
MHPIIDAARANLTDDLWDYIAGAAETETTSRRNRLAFDSLALAPRILRDVSRIDPSASLLGHPLRIPVVLAPLGALELITPEGAVAQARAAQRFGLLGFVSSVAEPSLEEVAAAVPGPKISQLYVRGDAAWVDELVDRVAAAGYAAIALTVDAAHYGRRERQLAHSWVPPGHREQTDALAWQKRLTWESVERIRDRAGMPLIVKGIQTAADAELAVEHGVDAIYVSNHGGRDLDHAPAALDALREIVEAVGGRAELIVDGGVMRGGDVLKALALGASAVGLGRLQALALAAGGADALVAALELLELEIVTTMGLLGVRERSELDAGFLRAAAPLPAASNLQAAFPAHAPDWRRQDVV